MLSNRESARRSRRRKQAHLGELQTKVDALTEENARLLQQLHALHASFNGVMQRNRIVKQNTAYLRAQLVAGQPPTREALEAATVAMNAGAHAEQMLRVVAAGNGDESLLRNHGMALPGNAHAPVMMPAGYVDASRMAANPGTSDGRGAVMTSAAAAAAAAAALGAGADPMFAPPRAAAFAGAGAPYAPAPMTGPPSAVPRPAAGQEGGQGRKAGGAGRGRATNFPIAAAGSRGRGSETSSLTVQHAGGTRAASVQKAGSPNVSMQSVDTKSYANAVKRDAGADAALAAAVAEHLALPTRPTSARAGRGDGGGADAASDGVANLDRCEAALAATVAAHLAVPGGDACGKTALGTPLVPRDFDLPGGAASASAAAAAAAQCGLGAQQGSDGSRADAGGGSSGDGSDGAAHGVLCGSGDGSGDVGAQSTRAPMVALPDEPVKDHHRHHGEIGHLDGFLVPGPGACGTEPGTEKRRDDARDDARDEDETDALGTFQDWFVEDGSGSGDPMRSSLDTRQAAQKIGRTDSMNRVASMERMAKRSARGEVA